MNMDAVTSAPLKFVRYLGDIFHRLVMTSVGASKNDKNVNEFFINIPPDEIWIKSIVALLAHG